MVTVAIVVILTAIALPSYQNSLLTSRRHDARVALLRIQQLEETWRANHVTYTDTLSDLNFSSTSENGLYTLSIVGKGGTGTPDGTGYRAQATAVSTKSQSKDAACQVIYLNLNGGTVSYGGRISTSAPDSPANSCW